MNGKIEFSKADDMAIAPEEIEETVKDEFKKACKDEEERVSLLTKAEDFLLAENDWRLDRLDETNPFWRWISGMEKKTNRRLRDNFQELHRITFKLVKQQCEDQWKLRKIIRRLDSENQREFVQIKDEILELTEVLDNLQKRVAIMEIKDNLKQWLYQGDRRKELLGKEPCQRLLSMVWGWYRINPNPDGGAENLEAKFSTIRELKLEGEKLSPQKFADVFWKDIDSLKPYVEELRTCRPQSDAELSPYGKLIFEIYDLCSSPQVRKLAEAAPEETENARKSCFNHYIEQNQVQPADAKDIFDDLFGDLQKAFGRENKWLEEQKEKRKEQKKQEEQAEQEKQESERQEEERKQEERKKYRLAVVSPEGSWLYNSDRSDCRSFIPEGDFSLSKESIGEVRRELQKFQPSLVIVPGADKAKWRKTLGDVLADEPQCTLCTLSEFYYRLWQSGLSGAENLNSPDADPHACVVLFDYYAHELWVSCFGKETDGIKYRQEPVRFNRTKGNIAKDVRKWLEETGMHATEGKIVYCYTFQTDEYIHTKMDSDKIGAKLMGREWQDKLRDPANLKKVMDKLWSEQTEKEDM